MNGNGNQKKYISASDKNQRINNERFTWQKDKCLLDPLKCLQLWHQPVPYSMFKSSEQRRRGGEISIKIPKKKKVQVKLWSQTSGNRFTTRTESGKYNMTFVRDISKFVYGWTTFMLSAWAANQEPNPPHLLKQLVVQNIISWLFDKTFCSCKAVQRWWVQSGRQFIAWARSCPVVHCDCHRGIEPQSPVRSHLLAEEKHHKYLISVSLKVQSSSSPLTTYIRGEIGIWYEMQNYISEETKWMRSHLKGNLTLFFSILS